MVVTVMEIDGLGAMLRSHLPQPARDLLKRRVPRDFLPFPRAARAHAPQWRFQAVRRMEEVQHVLAAHRQLAPAFRIRGIPGDLRHAAIFDPGAHAALRMTVHIADDDGFSWLLPRHGTLPQSPPDI